MIFRSFFLATMLFCAANAAAVTVFEQLPNASNGFTSDVDGDQSIAENFTLADETEFAQVEVWGIYFDGATPPISDDFTVRILADNAGSPGGLIYAESSVPVLRTPTGVILFSFYERFMYTLSLSTPQTLTSGTYWIEIYNDTTADANDDWLWETGSGGDNSHAISITVPGVTWAAGASDQALRLDGMVVPVELQSFDIE